MLNRKYLALGSGVALLAGAVIVHACGPYFSLQLLDNRAGTLAGTPTNSFAYEATHLVALGDRLLAPEAVPVPAGQMRPDPAKAALAGLTPAQIATLGATTKAADGDAAYAPGNGLPEAQRLYAAATSSRTIRRARRNTMAAMKIAMDPLVTPMPRAAMRSSRPIRCCWRWSKRSVNAASSMWQGRTGLPRSSIVSAVTISPMHSSPVSTVRWRAG